MEIVQACVALLLEASESNAVAMWAPCRESSVLRPVTVISPSRLRASSCGAPAAAPCAWASNPLNNAMIVRLRSAARAKRRPAFCHFVRMQHIDPPQMLSTASFATKAASLFFVRGSALVIHGQRERIDFVHANDRCHGHNNRGFRPSVRRDALQHSRACDIDLAAAYQSFFAQTTRETIHAGLESAASLRRGRSCRKFQ